MSTTTKTHTDTSPKPDDIRGLIDHARRGLLATLDAIAPAVATGTEDLTRFKGLFEALHALHAIDSELGRPDNG